MHVCVNEHLYVYIHVLCVCVCVSCVCLFVCLFVCMCNRIQSIWTPNVGRSCSLTGGGSSRAKFTTRAISYLLYVGACVAGLGKKNRERSVYGVCVLLSMFMYCSLTLKFMMRSSESKLHVVVAVM